MAGWVGAVVALAAGPLLLLLWSERVPPPAPREELPRWTEAAILADRPEHPTALRFARNDRIVVLDFPDLRSQGLALNRIAAFAEKVDEPHDRVLGNAELDAAIRARGDTVETYYYGHDYDAATLRRFFALADRDHVALGPGEEDVRRLAAAQGLLADGAAGALITLPREGADAVVDAVFRRTILRHELSHGEYFTNPDYAGYARRFWNEGMDEGQRAAFRAFLAGQDYDPALTDLTINEAQAFLMHTRDERVFNAAALGLAPGALADLRARFLLGMPPGWLRDCTSGPVAEAKP